MNAWNRTPKKNTTYMEQNQQRGTMYQADRNTAMRSTHPTIEQRQRGCPTRLRVRTGDFEIQWID